jgi:nucleoside-diphosphate-sugar epimerase
MCWKNVNKIFYSSSACVYPEFNQLNPLDPNCSKRFFYLAQPDSEYGWEKLFSERIYLAFNKNHNLEVRIGSFHNAYTPMGTWQGGEKVPAAMIRKAIEANENDSIEAWGSGEKTRSFLYIEECVNAVIQLMNSNHKEPINIGSGRLKTINDLAKKKITLSNKKIEIINLEGGDFIKKYGLPCQLGVMGRNSDNTVLKSCLVGKFIKI